MKHWRYEGRCMGWLDRYISECRYMISSCCYCYLHHHVYDFSVVVVVLEVSVVVIVVIVT